MVSICWEFLEEEVYNELYGVYRELYPATRGQVHKLANMQQGGSEIVK